MLKKMLLAAIATTLIGAATLSSADASDRFRHRHHGGSGVTVYFGSGGGFYGDRYDRHFGYPSRFYGDGYGYGRRSFFRDRYAFDGYRDYDDFGPICTTRRVKVKDWNRSHTRYKIVTRRIREC
jgi:hypothetical protein